MPLKEGALFGPMDDKYFSTSHEPALRGSRFEPDPAEQRAGSVDRPPDELEALRDSVAAEPALPQHGDPDQWNRWLQEKRRGCTLSGNMAVTAVVAMLGGPFAVLGALMAGRQGASGYVYAIVFGPVIEELLKQSGMMYLLEKKPYRLFATWQFVFAALVSGLTFAVIENLVYLNVYFYALAPGRGNVAALAAFRWAVCTSLHVVCAGIASLGLVRVWKKQLQDGRPADLAAAVPYFAAAMIIHGLYNLWAIWARF